MQSNGRKRIWGRQYQCESHERIAHQYKNTIDRRAKTERKTQTASLQFA